VGYRALEHIGAIGHDLTEYQHFAAMLVAMDRVDIGNVDMAVVDLFEVIALLVQQPHRAAAQLHHVPFDRAGIDHRLDLVEVGAGEVAHLDAGEALERLEIGAPLRVLHGAAVTDDP
jgi:hypothetical protein